MLFKCKGHCESAKGETKQSVHPKTALPSNSLFHKNLNRGSITPSFLIIFTFLILLLTPLGSIYSQTSQLNPDTIPFAPVVNYSVGGCHTTVFCADLDSDSSLDLAVTNFNNDSVSILKNNGDGTFYLVSNYQAGDGPWTVLCVDLDGDGDLDLAVSNIYSGNVSILKNNGDGTFQAKVDYGTGAYPYRLARGDLDGDGDGDLVAANDLGDRVSILKNNGDGTFQNKVDYVIGLPHSVFCADLDGDLDLDLAVTRSHLSNSFAIFRNDGDGNFGAAETYGGIYEPVDVFCADLDQDGDLDLVMASAGANKVSVFVNNGDGTFQSAVDYNVRDPQGFVFCADLDGDSYPDIAVAHSWSKDVSILKNNGDGTFGSAVNYSTGDWPYGVFCADLDGDKDLDLVTSNCGSNNVSILMNLTPHPLGAFLLLTPTAEDSLKNIIHFNWQASIDPDPRDTVRYDLYLNRSMAFAPESTIVYDGLLDTSYTDSLDLKTWYWKVKAYDKWGATRWSNQTWSFYVYLCGDGNGDAQVNMRDVLYLVKYIFAGGPAPKPLATGDVNCDGQVNFKDVLYLIRYIFTGGSKPC